MKLFLDTADTAVIKKWVETGIIDGVTTNPSHLSKAGGDAKKRVQEIIKLLPKGEISVEVTQKEPQQVYKQAKEIAQLSKNILVKIPCHADYYAVIHKLAQEGVRLNITLVFTVIQGVLMSKLGVQYISPFIGRWDDIDVQGSNLLYEMRQIIDQYEYSTNILAASLRSVRHVHDALLSCADAITLPPDVLEKATQHILTDQGITQFDADWKKLGIKSFP